MKLRELFAEADPKDLGSMNDKMRNVLSKVHSDDEAEKQAAKDKAEAERQAKVKELGPKAMDDYIAKLKAHDWYYDMSDDHRAWKAGNDSYKAIMNLKKVLDPDGKIYDKYSPFNKESVSETATAGATSSANVASATPVAAHTGGKSYTGSPGKSGTKAPKTPAVKQPKNKDGTAKNGLDMKGANLLGGQGLMKR